MIMDSEKRILIVDDTKENIDVLGEVLSGYKKSVALDGQKAIKIALEKKPDIILLDIMMPDMDGFEVCQKLKEMPETREIPVIFITAKNQIEDEVRGLELGAVDFIAKPISPPVVLARVKNHLELKESREQLLLKNNELVGTIAELKQTQNQLVQSEKLAALGNLISNIAHEINSPFGAIKSSNEVILSSIKQFIATTPKIFNELSPSLITIIIKLLTYVVEKDFQISASDERTARKELLKIFNSYDLYDNEEIADILVEMGIYRDVEQFIPLLEDPNAEAILRNCSIIAGFLSNSEIIKIAVDRVAKIVFALKNYSRFSNSEEKSFAKLSEGIEIVLVLYHNKTKHGVEITKEYRYDEAISCYPDELNQVWTNIIHNALQAMDFKGKLSIKIDREDNFAVIAIKDSGVGIPENIMDKIFDPFFTTKPLGEGSGIGLDIVRRIVEKHQGKIVFESKVGVGTEFKVYLPI